MAAAGFKRTAVTITAGRPSTYSSSPGVRRGFCGACGTSLSYENERWPDDIHLMVAIFDRPESFAPQLHIFAGARLPWLHLADDLPRYRTTPSAGERMDESQKSDVRCQKDAAR